MGTGTAMQSLRRGFHNPKLRGCSAAFYGKVGFPPLCPHWLPDPGWALCECVCVECRHCCCQRALQQAERQGCDRPELLLQRPAAALLLLLLPFSVVLPCCHPGWFLLFYFFVNRGASRCGRASGVSGSSEQQGCMSWAVCSPFQRTGEMLLKGQ